MKTLKIIGLHISLILFANYCFSQQSEIKALAEDKAYQYLSYYENGQIEKQIGFFAKQPYQSIEEFEVKLKDYKIKEHGASKEFYPSGQLKKIVVYKKGKVIEYAKHYFEDGEQFSVPADELAEFQFTMEEQDVWFARKIKDVEQKYGITLEGKGIIALDISYDGTIKAIQAKGDSEEDKKYLIEIGEQIKVVQPALKDGKPIGTKFAFRIEL